MFLEAIIAAIVFVSFALQVILNLPDDGTLVNSVWQLLRYFTILTNLAIGVVMLRAVATQVMPSAQVSAAMTTWIIVVGLVYHALLAQQISPATLAFWADQGLHTAVPILTVLWWGVRARKKPLRPVQAVIWAAFPVAYLIYTLGRGMVDGVYPYFFVDPRITSWGAIAAWVAALASLFVLLGLGLIFLARSRWLQRF